MPFPKRSRDILKRVPSGRLGGITGYVRVPSMIGMEHPLTHSRKLSKRVTTSIGGAAKRRKRKGGHPRGGPGKKGAGMTPNTARQRRGYLA